MIGLGIATAANGLSVTSQLLLRSPGWTEVASGAAATVLRMGKRKRKNAFEMRLAVGDAGGLRSTVWKVWVPRGRDDAYLAPAAPTLHASFHNPAASETRPPFHLKATFTPVIPGDPSPSPVDARMGEWGPIEDSGPGVWLLAQVVIPGSELRDHDEPPGLGRAIRWIAAPGDGEAAILSIYSLPPTREGVTFRGPPAGSLRESASFTLPTGRTLVVMASVNEMAPWLSRLIAVAKGRYREGLFKTIADGSAPPFEGVTRMEGVLPIAAGGGVQGFLELNLGGFAILAPA